MCPGDLKLQASRKLRIWARFQIDSRSSLLAPVIVMVLLAKRNKSKQNTAILKKLYCLLAFVAIQITPLLNEFNRFRKENERTVSLLITATFAAMVSPPSDSEREGFVRSFFCPTAVLPRAAMFSEKYPRWEYLNTIATLA